MRYGIRRHVYLAAAIVIVLLAACRGDDSHQSPTPDPAAVLQAAGQRFGEITSAHYTLQIDGDVFLDDQHLLALRSAEGDLLRPDSATAKANISAGGPTLTVNMIAIGEQQYITNFLTGRWEQAPEGFGYNPAILFNEQQGIQGILTKVDQASLVGTEDVGGAQAQHLRGVVARDAVSPLTGDAFQGNRIDVDLWVTTDTHDLAKIVLHDTAPPAQGATAATWTLVISNQDSPVEITAPPV